MWFGNCDVTASPGGERGLDRYRTDGDIHVLHQSSVYMSV